LSNADANAGDFPSAAQVLGVGRINTGALDVESWWDLRHKHSTFASEPYAGRPYYINERAPKEYNDEARFATAAGLNLIMR
jgi:hypothetical protein